MERFFGDKVIFGKKYLNPFRPDNNPKCFFMERDHLLLFCDFASKYWGDCVAITSYRLGTGLYPALQFINKEYNLGLGEPTGISAPIINFDYHNADKQVKNYSTIVYQRYEDFADNDYFFDFGITKQTLNLFGVIPVHKVWVKNNNHVEVFTSTEKEPIYVYTFKENESDYKVYRPKSKIEKKWRSNCKRLQGYTEDTDDLVIRTSSLKDVMVLHECGFISDAAHCENALDKPRKNMVLLYDNDNAGKRLALKHSQEYNCKYFFMPDSPNLKDPSDFSKAFGLEFVKNYVLEQCKYLKI